MHMENIFFLLFKALQNRGGKYKKFQNFVSIFSLAKTEHKKNV